MSAANREILDGALAAVRRAGADSADSVLVEVESLEARVRDREIDFVKQARERTLGIRAFVAGSVGRSSAVTSTSDLSRQAVVRMAEETVALARATAQDAAAGLPEAGFADAYPDLGLSEPADRNVPLDERIDSAFQAEAAARDLDPRIDNSEGSQISSEFAEVVYGNTEGFCGAYESASHGLFSEPLARGNGTMQRDYWMTAGRRLADLEAPERVGRRAAERALRRLGARRVPTCEVPVIFEPLTARSLLGHLAGCINGYSLYRGASFLAGKLGETLGSDLLTVVDDGRLPGALGSKPFDGEGQPTRRTLVLERGRLESYLLDTYSARKLDLVSTGNAARSAGSAPSVAPTNLWLEPGEPTLEEIIASTPKGLLVTELIGMGFNPVTGDYSRGAAGLWIEGGELTHPVEEITIAGNLIEMLTAVDAVGCDLLRVGSIAAPSVRIGAMTVAGE